MQKIVILGQPNVGKSSLFNCLLKERVAVTSSISGTTRDINIKQMLINERAITLCDTAGILENECGIFEGARERILDFIDENDLVLYVISSENAIDERDVRLFRTLKNAILVVNKIDLRGGVDEWEYGIFGAKKLFFISTAHNRGLIGLRDFIALQLTLNPRDDFLAHLESHIEARKLRDCVKDSRDSTLDSGRDSMKDSTESGRDSAKDSTDSAPETINIGIIGRVNVGKSALLNALLGKERALVSEVEGTTIDPVDDTLRYKGKILRFVDTAGIRRKGRIEGIEKFALERTSGILEKSDIALLVLDSAREFCELDEKIGGLSDKYKLGIIVILNKWDIKCADFKRISGEFKRKFAYLSHAPIITTSAVLGRHIELIKEKILEVWESLTARIPTAKLNASIARATAKHPLPSDKGKMVKIYYATQIAAKPPQIVLVMNRPNALHFSYKRYLINALRREFPLKGTPILLLPRPKNTDLVVSQEPQE